MKETTALRRTRLTNSDT